MRARCKVVSSTPWLPTTLPINTLAPTAAEALSTASTGDGSELFTVWRVGLAPGLSLGLAALRLDADAGGGARRRAPHRLGQYRRHQCVAHRAQGLGGGHLVARPHQRHDRRARGLRG